jgi:hypothetical protein
MRKRNLLNTTVFFLKWLNLPLRRKCVGGNFRNQPKCFMEVYFLILKLTATLLLKLSTAMTVLWSHS